MIAITALAESKIGLAASTSVDVSKSCGVGHRARIAVSACITGNTGN
jgi:hypothetical protein